MLAPKDLITEVRVVLQKAKTGKGKEPGWLTAYQILERTPSRDTVIRERGLPGRGAGTHYPAANVVADALERMINAREVELLYLECGGATFAVAGQIVTPGYELTGIYRLR